MIRNIIFGALTIMLAAGSAEAKKEKTAQIKDKVATDLKYDWKLPIPDNWKAHSENEPSVERLFMQKKNYQVNPYIKQYGGDYTIPRVVIFVQQFAGTVDDFENLLKSSLDQHQSDNEIINRMDLLKDGEFIISGDVQVDSLPARQIYLKRNYIRLLFIPEGGGGVGEGRQEYVNDHEVHEVYLIKKGDLLYVFQAYCEREFFDANEVEFHSLIQSFVL